MVIAPLEENISSQEATTSDNNLSVRPTILVFDSGVGGLSVYREVKKLIPNAHYIYAFDNEAFPYGEKSEEFIIDRVYQIVNAIAKKHPLTIAVIACNTASTVSLPNLRANFTFPIVGVVPAIKPATKLTRNGVVGLLATRGTVNREYTKELIERFATDCKVISLGSAELVQLAERKLHGEILPLDEVAQAVKPWIKMKEAPDTVILGCTHFPLIVEELEKVLPSGTRFIDSGAAIARRTVWLINNQAEVTDSNEEDFAYCLLMNESLQELRPVLEAEGFKSLKKLAI
ncbi:MULTISPECIES: glutamate racemase [Providencia]|uniref:glutamate racemase n=1 Tax=Providencia TaxID=586 RepID=UPI0012B56C76|nr:MULTISPECIES: glutamate racemase [Providencia]MTC70946.1 glutamate racemase [Providencia sp. wls1914]QLR06706.1 glutamate racemase [Providencia rettgeri]